MKLMLIKSKYFSSFSATKRTPKDYEWYKFKGTRSVKILDGHKIYEQEIMPNETYGIRKRGTSIYLVDSENPEIEFKLTEKIALSLLNRSEGWSGKVGKYKVEAGSFAAKDKPKNTLRDKKIKDIKSVPGVTVNTTRTPNADSPRLRAMLNSTKIKGIERASLLFSEEILPGEWYYYYDLSQCLDTFKDAKGKLKSNWDSSLQRIIETKTRLEANASITKYKGATIPVLVISDLD